MWSFLLYAANTLWKCSSWKELSSMRYIEWSSNPDIDDSIESRLGRQLMNWQLVCKPCITTIF